MPIFTSFAGSALRPALQRLPVDRHAPAQARRAFPAAGNAAGDQTFLPVLMKPRSTRAPASGSASSAGNTSSSVPDTVRRCPEASEIVVRRVGHGIGVGFDGDGSLGRTRGNQRRRRASRLRRGFPAPLSIRRRLWTIPRMSPGPRFRPRPGLTGWGTAGRSEIPRLAIVHATVWVADPELAAVSVERDDARQVGKSTKQMRWIP